MYEKSIELLNAGLRDELHAVHQYMYFHFHLDDQGYDLLSNLFKRIAIMEMGHVETFAERVLFLKGEVTMVAAEEVKPVTEVTEILKLAREMEIQSAASYNKWANEVSAANDAVSKKIFETLVADEEGHADIFDNELDKINQFGDRYLALQSIDRSRAASAGTPSEE